MDVLFQDYISNYGAQMSDHDLEALEKLLAIDDPVLFDAFSGKTRLKDTRLNVLLSDIKAKVAGT